ncbi:MAG: DUF3800 domain-containing protein [Planctomycetota bacterium]|jgi:hypothetical protein
MAEGRLLHNYFVDEAGDPILFNKRRQIIVGKEGVSRVFMVGVAYLPDPKLAYNKLEQLRAELLADPYFRNVPSMRPSAKKTAVYFHAKDDPPEVRREVFKLLPELGAKVQVAIRRKEYLVKTAQTLYKLGRKLSPDEVYDDLVKRLFKNLLHKADENRIVFARRGKASRQHGLQNAIGRAKANFERKTGVCSKSKVVILSAYPSESAGLQVIDYHLWALQRMFERGEDRFFRLLAAAFRLVMDLDDTRNRPYGEWYSDSNQLDLKKIKPAAG